MSQRRRGGGPIAAFMLIQIYTQLERLPVKPPVTIALLCANILPFFMDINLLGYNLSSVNQNCLNPARVITAFVDGDGLLMNRLFLSALIHADESHLYYNMMSLTWKGINLEIEMGSAAFLQLVVFSLVVSHCLVVVIAYLLYMYTDFTGTYHTCMVGFSAVLFSLKYVWNQKGSGDSNIMGINFPSKYAAWLELVLISLIHPNVSFVGHLAGIFAGIIYVHGPALLKTNIASGSTRSSNNFGGGRVGGSATRRPY
jgi:rhomboid domain-containing protein 1